MQNKLYRFSEGSAGRAEINASSGWSSHVSQGRFDPSYFNKYELDQQLFCLLRKV